jgi:predicted transposase YbfD/YdcC
MEKLIGHLSELDDPRCPGKVEHRLIDILVIAVCAVIACAESWEDIVLYGRSKQDWLRRFLALPNGVPSHDTFRRVFILIDPDAFEACFTAWAQGIAPLGKHEVVAIDGKTVRRSFDWGREQAPLHWVSAWASEQGLVLGQRRVDDKSNEITAIPELLDAGAGRHPGHARCHGLSEGDCPAHSGPPSGLPSGIEGQPRPRLYGRAKAFRPPLLSARSPLRPEVDGFDESHGRLVRRRVFASAEAATLPVLADWPKLRTVLAVESIGSVNDGCGKVEADIRYFLSSSTAQAPLLAQAIRRHWSIENNLHWVLDVNFREDESRLRDPTATRNFALLRKIALNLVGHDRSKNTSLRAKRKKAAWDNNYMGQLLSANFMH